MKDRPFEFKLVTVCDEVTRAQMARFKGKDIVARELAIVAADFYGLYNKALIVPEANTANFGFMEWLREMGIQNIYIHILQSGQTTEGYPTNQFTKPVMKDNFRDVIYAGACDIRSADMLREIRNYRLLVRKGRGAMGAPAGANDDELMTGFMAFMPEVMEQARLYSGIADKTNPQYRTSSVQVH